MSRTIDVPLLSLDNEAVCMPIRAGALRVFGCTVIGSASGSRRLTTPSIERNSMGVVRIQRGLQIQRGFQIQRGHRLCGKLPLRLCGCLFGLLLLSGCGRATYERRMLQTIELAKYRQKLDENLSQTWKKKGVEVRAPRQFTAIRAPKPPAKKKEGEDDVPEELPPDLRQPKFLAIPLPGLIGAWTAEVELNEPEGRSQAYMYILSNYTMWEEAGQGEAALKFNLSIAPNGVVDGLRAKLPEPAEWISESHPRSQGFVASKRLTAAIVKANLRLPFVADAKAEESAEGDSTEEAEADGEGKSDEHAEPEPLDIDVNCKMFLIEKKDIKVMVLFIVPANISERENLSLDTAKKRSSRIAMCLETLNVSSTKPRPRKKGDEKTSGGGRGTGF